MSTLNTAHTIVPARRSKLVDDTVWEWIHEVSEESPIQPVSNLGTGFVEYNPPAFLRDEHARVLNNVGDNQYAPVPGTSVLRQTIAQMYSLRHRREIDASSEVCITSGAQEGLLSCVMAFVEAGEEVILIEPVFAMYIYQVEMANATAKYVSLKPPPGADDQVKSGNEWTLDFRELEAAITPRTKAIYFNNPHNPLGKVFTRDELLGIGNLCVEHNILLISDEVYERIAFEQPLHCNKAGPHIPMASLSPEISARTLTAISLGKLFNASGWRVGFIVGPKQLLAPVEATHLVLAYSSSAPAQQACVKGLKLANEKNWWQENVRDLARRCQFVCDVLDEIGLTYVAPAGAWFVFVNISRVRIPEEYEFPQIVRQWGNLLDWRVCFFLVQEFGISSIPGSCFYSVENAHLGAKWLRFGTCKSDEGLALARERLLKLKPFIGSG